MNLSTYYLFLIYRQFIFKSNLPKTVIGHLSVLKYRQNRWGCLLSRKITDKVFEQFCFHQKSSKQSRKWRKIVYCCISYQEFHCPRKLFHKVATISLPEEKLPHRVPSKEGSRKNQELLYCHISFTFIYKCCLRNEPWFNSDLARVFWPESSAWLMKFKEKPHGDLISYS